MKMFAPNATDCYKVGHKPMYHEDSQFLYSNLTPRSDRLFNGSKGFDGKMIWFGVQGFCMEVLVEMWNQSFFNQPKEKVVDRYKRRMASIFGPDVISDEHIAELHDLGYLPLHVMALPEGTRVPMGIPVLTINNTVEGYGWLVNYLESVLSAYLWKMSTSATIAFEYRRTLERYARKTGGAADFIPLQAHDFSFRGMSGPEDAARTGAGHILSFIGSDNIPAMDYLEEYYGAGVGGDMIATSVPASEHSVSSSNILFIEQAIKDGKYNGPVSRPEGFDDRMYAELIFMHKMITELFPKGIVSYVSDTYDYWAVVTKIVPALKDEIMTRKPDFLGLNKLVIRPDCYSEDTSILTPDGWKPFCDLTEDDLVAQVTDSGEYEFVKPLKIVDQEYVGKMHHFKDHHGKVDLLVTPNHRMVLEQNGKGRIEYAEKLKSKGNSEQKMFRSARASGQRVSLTDLERLKIAFQADGSFVAKQDTCIRFSFSKARKITRMRELLIRAGYSYNEYKLSDGKVEFNIKLAASNFQKDFEWVVFDKLDSNWACEFIDELSHWDSSVRNESRFKFDTTTKSVIDKVELIAIAAGKGVLISETEDNREDHFSKVYTAHIMDNNSVGGQSWRHDIVDYSGRVYCVTVPSGKVLVKRNRCTMVSGNSGDPIKIICGDPDAEVGSTEYKGTIEILWETFGGTVNEKGYKTLDEHIGLIYGDGITMKRQECILAGLAAKGFASDNVVFGVGSYTYQHVTRDTFGTAMKATFTQIAGEHVAIFKDPKTGAGKKSAKGLLAVVEDENGELKLLQDLTLEQYGEFIDYGQTLFETVFIDGEVDGSTTLNEIKARLVAELKKEIENA